MSLSACKLQVWEISGTNKRRGFKEGHVESTVREEKQVKVKCSAQLLLGKANFQKGSIQQAVSVMLICCALSPALLPVLVWLCAV